MSIGPRGRIRAAMLVLVPTMLVLVATAPARGNATVTHQVVKDTARHCCVGRSRGEVDRSARGEVR
jgi:hypothetical protein